MLPATAEGGIKFEDYQVKISESPELDPEWDAFVASTLGGDHVQTSRWALVKSVLGWKATRVAVLDGSRIIGGAQLLRRSFSFLGSVGYVTKGPLCCLKDPELPSLLLHKIKQISRQHRCHMLAIQPPYDQGDLVGTLKSASFSASKLDLGPTASVVLDLEAGPDMILKNMTRETRHRIRHSQRESITVHEGSQSDLGLFYQLYLATAARQGFTPYHRSYFDMLWETFAPKGWISLLVAYHENEAVSAQLLVPFGDTVLCKMMGWSGEHSRLRPNHALYWGSILWTIGHGYRYFDFGGVDPRGAAEILDGKKVSEVPAASNDIIKYGYGGEVLFYPQPYHHFPNMIFDRIFRCMAFTIGNTTLPNRVMEHFRKR
jgi:lipid II:glycine glycyltransferase (peptidoglycan interpeptide bridge formation enzyme)